MRRSLPGYAWFSLMPMLVLVASVAACSDGGAASGGVSTSAGTPPQSVDVVVAAAEWRFVPGQLSAPAGDTMTVELRNDGTIVHNWTVLSSRVATESDFREDMGIAGVTAESGAIERVTFPTPPPGQYQVICTIPGHYSSGMEGLLIVENG